MNKECIAMLLAGGQGSRLGVLTRQIAKPAVPFGGKYRIIDFALSNCTNSGIDTVGVLTQYQPHELNAYIGSGRPWDLDRMYGGVRILPPYLRGRTGKWYQGTADAVYQNLPFIELYQPEYVLILSGDHIYKMDYGEMLAGHRDSGADCTIAVIEVPPEEASRYGIMHIREDGTIDEFEEKPKRPRSNKASMGVYIFTWKKLRHYLEIDQKRPGSENDFGKNVIPAMLSAGEKMMAHHFRGYWKDVGTIESFWQANMDLLEENDPLRLKDPAWRIYSNHPMDPPHYLGREALVRHTIMAGGCVIHGSLDHCVVSQRVRIESGARIDHSVIMSGVRVEAGAFVSHAILADRVVIGRDARIGAAPGDADSRDIPITLIGEDLFIGAESRVDPGCMVESDISEARAT